MRFSFLIFLITLILVSVGCVAAAEQNMTTDIINSADEPVTSVAMDDVLTEQSKELDIRADDATYKYSNSKTEYRFMVYNSTSNTPMNRVHYTFDYNLYDRPVEGYSDSNGICTVKIIPSKIPVKYSTYIEVHYKELWNIKYINLKVDGAVKNEGPVTVKVSAPSKTVYYKTNNYFKATIKNTNNNPVKNLKVKLKVYTGSNYKTYYRTTNSNGVISFNTKSLSTGTHKIVLSSTNKKYKLSKTSTVSVKKKTTGYTVTLKLKPNSIYYSEKRLKTGDLLLAAATSRQGQHAKGVTIGTMIDAGQEGQHSTKIIKGIVYYKNMNTGKIITRTQTSTVNNNRNLKKLPWITGYTPYKAKIWYKKQ